MRPLVIDLEQVVAAGVGHVAGAIADQQPVGVAVDLQAGLRPDRPDRRIDYIWLSAGLEATGFAATTSTASDHRGIAVTVR
jgi:endonuclease/exonuclease/phosphatase family metal-dependent hydrolase